MRSALILLLFITALCWAQPAFELRGVVADPGTGQPIQDANVSIYPEGLMAPANEIKLKTDAAGTFRHTPTKGGMFILLVRKDGYTAVSAAAARGGAVMAQANLTEQKPSVELRIEMQRPGEISGVVIDDQTEKPIANLRIEVAPYRSTNGRPSARFGTVATTGADGTFRAQNLPAGEYLIATVPQVSGPAHTLAKFSEDDIRATDLDYRREYFPGGPDIDAALPVVLPSSGSIHVGTIRVKKQPLNRVYLNLDTSSCLAGLPLLGSEVNGDRTGSVLIKPFPCGPLLLTHVTPGTYEASLSTGSGTVMATHTVRYTVTSSNLDLPMRLSKGTDLNGTILAAEGAGELPLATFKIRLGPIGLGVAPIAVDSKGRFAVRTTFGGRLQVTVDGLGTEFYIKQVRLAKQAAPGGLFDYAGSGDLEIEIGRSPAAFSATVMNRDKPVPGADVVFMRWPAEPEDDTSAIRHLAADADGKAQISGLAPGEYRVFAVLGTDRSKAEQPAAWQRLTSRAEKITLDRGASRSVVLAVSDPAR